MDRELEETMTDDQIEIVTLLLHTMRKTEQAGEAQNAQDVRDVVKALEVAGFVMLPKGIIETLQKILK